MCDEIKEVIYPEWRALERFPNAEQEDLERCACGSSLFRIVRDAVPEGHDYCFVCAKCNSYIGGILNDLKATHELCKTCKNKRKKWDEEPCIDCEATSASKYEPEER